MKLVPNPKYAAAQFEQRLIFGIGITSQGEERLKQMGFEKDELGLWRVPHPPRWENAGDMAQGKPSIPPHIEVK